MELKLCLIGFGNAARAFCTLLSEQADIMLDDFGCRVTVTAIAGRSKGTLLDDEGIDLEALADSMNSCGKLSSDGSALLDLDARQVIERCNADVLLELSTLSIEDGQPAISHIEAAFEKGMHVITANKGPIAWDFARLEQMAAGRQLEFLYETVVMDGTPVFNLVRETLPGCRILGFKGILNSTTNFILDEMERGGSFDAAVAEAQARGFAEADPSLDIDGWDAAAKTSALANALMGADLKPTDIDRTGIAAVTSQDVESAAAQGKKIRLICEARLDDGKAVGKVSPEWVDESDVYSKIDATSSILTIKTSLMGEISIIEKDPEIEQTAYGIFSDLLTLIRRLK